jgi:hypothetical protein
MAGVTGADDQLWGRQSVTRRKMSAPCVQRYARTARTDVDAVTFNRGSSG